MVSRALRVPEIHLFINHRIVNSESALLAEEYLLLGTGQCLASINNRITDDPAQHSAVAEHAIKFVGNGFKICPRKRLDTAVRPKRIVRRTGQYHLHAARFQCWQHGKSITNYAAHRAPHRSAWSCAVISPPQFQSS